MYRLMLSTLFYFVIIGLFMTISYFVGLGLKATTSWIGTPIPADHAVYWGYGVTLLFTAYYVISKRVETYNVRKTFAKLFPISNENLSICRDALVCCIENHLDYIAAMLETIGESEDHSESKELVNNLLSFQRTFQNIHSKISNKENLSDEELRTLNDLLIQKNIIIVIGETEAH